MKVLIVRHADPDYSIDSLTPTGWKEAEALSEMLAKLDIKKAYISHLGRAKDTAMTTIKKTNWPYEIHDFLEEFNASAYPTKEKPGHVAWDWYPRYLCDEDHTLLFDPVNWHKAKGYEDLKIKERYDWVCDGFDKILANHGYVRNGKLYDAVEPNDDTIVIFCHFGLECVLLSHLMNVSPVVLWQGMCAAPSSVTTVITEEREKGIAYFRVLSFGDVSHLYVKGMKPSFSARFCELYTNENERH